ncbi:MAG: leucine-rich repeat domain-containing protein [Eubacterium sp.]|nr:leucine-rich repeat domain-containing protein [Eubacterium sp.]
MNRTKRLLSVLLAIVMLFSVTAGMHITSQAAVLPSSGWCGDGVKFKFNGKKLTIYGKGRIQYEAFDHQEAIRQVVIKKGVTEIGWYAFKYCSNLKSVKIPSSVKEIGDSAFEDCSNLKSVKIPSSVKEIGSAAFAFCSNLKSIKIPGSVKEIGVSAFCGCSSLRSVKIPKSVKYIDGYGFNGCDKLKDVYYGGSKADAKKIRAYKGGPKIKLKDLFPKAKIHYNS